MDIREFDRLIMGGTYRLISDKSKAPINNYLYGIDEALATIVADGRPLRLGWMVSDDYIVIDVDSKEDDPERLRAKQVFKALSDRNIKMIMYSTEHGGHFIFRRGEYEMQGVVKVMTAMGVRVDVRVKGNYVILPFNDNKRKWWKQSREPELIPDFLKIVTKSKNAEEVFGLQEGDGRNDAIFRHLMRIKSSQLVRFDADQLRDSIELANAYLLAEPMDARELDSTVLRPENLVVNKPASGNETAVFSEYANRIAEENHILYTNGVFFMIRDESNVYRQIDRETMDRFIYMNYTKKLKAHDREEVMKAICHECYVPWSECNADPYDVPFLNGIINVKTGGTRQITPSDNITYVIPHYFNPQAKIRTPNVQSFYDISLEGNPDKQKFFSQMLGYCMTRSAEYQVFFVFKGVGGTGKSTLVDVVRNIMGSDNISDLQLYQFEKDFGVEALFNKLVNLGDDISGAKLVDSDTFKKASSGDVINIGRKYKDDLVFRPFAKIIFTTNPPPKIVDKTGAMQRRMRLVSSNRIVRPEERNPNFVRDLTAEDYQVIINDALTAIFDLLGKGGKVPATKTFPDPAESLRMKEELRILQDRTYNWIKTEYTGVLPQLALDGKGTMSQYQKFVDFCKVRGYNVLGFDNFVAQIMDTLDYSIINDEEVATDIFASKERIGL